MLVHLDGQKRQRFGSDPKRNPPQGTIYLEEASRFLRIQDGWDGG
jgi:hypothetical protein